MIKLMKKRIKKVIVVLSIFVMAMGLTISPTLAADDTALDVSFTIKAVQPSNQIDKNVSYFDLRVKPKQEQTIQIVVTNSSDKEIEANVELNNASTGTNGVILYSKHGVRDESLKLALEDIGTVQQPKVKLAPKSSKKVDIKLSLPDVKFNGMVLGGIYVTALDPNSPPKTNEDGIKIENKLAYVLAVKLTQNDTVVLPDMHFHGVTPKVEAMRTAMAINLQNSEAALMKQVSIDAQIFKRGEDTPLHTANTKTAEISPNTNFNFIVDWENQKIEAGDYRIRLVVRWQDKEWVWDENFVVKPDQANEVNTAAINIEESNFTTWIFAGLGGLAIIMLLYLLFIIMKRRKDEEESTKTA